MVTTRTYRNDNLTTLIDVRDGSNAQLDSFAYTYDANQNKTAETRTGVMAPWGWSTGTSGYDAEDRLRAWNRTDGQLTQGWNLTLEGDWQQFTQNGTPQNRTHGPAHELAAVGGTGLTYDVKGNLTQAVTGHRYTWDFDNQLQGVDTSGDQVADVTIGYDALGRRVKKTASGATKVYVSATQPIAYSPQAGQELAEYVSGAAPTSPTEKYVYGDYIDEPIWKTGTGGAVYYHANALYCVSALTNGSGAVVERYRYTPYGELTILAADGTTVRSASNYANPYTYTGRRWDSETGLYYYRARYYHPALGRFLGRDPIGYASGDASLYRYVGSRPMTTLDPSGYWSKADHYSLEEAGVAAYHDEQGIGEKCTAWMLEHLKKGNTSQDHEGLKDGYRHYNRSTKDITQQQMLDSDVAYHRYLKREWRNYTHLLSTITTIDGSGEKETCESALQSLGRLHHSYQDFFIHAIRRDGLGGKETDQPSSFTGWIAWTATPPVTGDPYRRGAFWPSSWSLFGGGEHPLKKEPLVRSGPEATARFNAAQTFMEWVTIEEFPWFFEKCWCVCSQLED